jgi:hypothetical protein
VTNLTLCQSWVRVGFGKPQCLGYRVGGFDYIGPKTLISCGIWSPYCRHTVLTIDSGFSGDLIWLQLGKMVSRNLRKKTSSEVEDRVGFRTGLGGVVLG